MKRTYKNIFKQIKKYDTIFIARHIGADPDALASQFGLKESILETFPDKTIYAVGVAAARFKYLGSCVKTTEEMEDIKKDSLLIVVDTPDIKRIDGAKPEDFKYTIKIDHHPFVDEFGDIDFYDTDASSASQIVSEIILSTPLVLNKSIATKLYKGIVFDTGRFMFSYTSSKTFDIISKLMANAPFDVSHQYDDLYMRNMKVIRFFGYIAQNMTVTKNGLGYIKVPNEIFKEYSVDAGTSGNIAERLNHITELKAWAIFSEDSNNSVIKTTIRSRGPIINTVAEDHGGGGHPFASGIRIFDTDINDDEIDQIIYDLDDVCKEYKETKENE